MGMDCCVKLSVSSRGGLSANQHSTVCLYRQRMLQSRLPWRHNLPSQSLQGVGAPKKNSQLPKPQRRNNQKGSWGLECFTKIVCLDIYEEHFQISFWATLRPSFL